MKMSDEEKRDLFEALAKALEANPAKPIEVRITCKMLDGSNHLKVVPDITVIWAYPS